MAPLGEYFRPGLWALKPFYRVIADALFVWGNAGRYHPRVLPTDAGIDSRGTGGNGGGGTGGAGSGRILDMDAFARGEQEVLAHAQQCQAVVVDTLQRVAEGMVVMGEQVGFPWNLCKKGGLCGFCGWGSRGPDVGGSIDDVHSVSSAADAITSASSSDRSEGGDDRGSLVVPRQGNIINGHGHAPRHEERLQRRPSAENARTRRRSHSRSSMILQCCVSIVEVEEQDDVEVTKRDIWEVTVPQSSLVAVEDMLSQLGERLLLHILGVRTRPVGGHIMDTSACRCPPTRDQLLRSFQAPYIPRGNSNSPAPATALAPTASTSSSRGPSTSTVSSSWTASRDSSHRAPSLGARSSQSEASYTPRSVTIAQTIDEEDEEDSYLEESTTAQTTATGDDATEPRHQQQNEQSPRRHEDDVASAATTTRRLSPEQVNLLSDDRGGSLAQWRSTNGNGAGVDSDAGVVGMGAVLTVGARRLEKMQRRSGNGWWGAPTGSVAEKNTAALSVVRRILDDALCMNIHADPSLGGKGDDVFEVRIAEGYGARWSSDGMTFRGFLDT